MIIEEDSETSIKTISPEEWMQQLEKIRISKMDMNKLIMNFFLIEGYKEAAENFQREAGIESKMRRRLGVEKWWRSRRKKEGRKAHEEKERRKEGVRKGRRIDGGGR